VSRSDLIRALDELQQARVGVWTLGSAAARKEAQAVALASSDFVVEAGTRVRLPFLGSTKAKTLMSKNAALQDALSDFMRTVHT